MLGANVMKFFKNLWGRFTDLSTLWKSVIIGGAAVLIIGIIVLIIFLNSGITASTMRLLKIEGNVTLQDVNGDDKSLVDNMRFTSGDVLNTGAQSLASIALDDSKTVTLEENSRATFNQSRNMLQIDLQSGGLFFDVNKPLEDDETFDIVTSTMTVGIRGTSGYVFVDNQGLTSIILTTGTVHVVGINPTTGETKQTTVSSGHRATVYLFNNRSVGSVDFVISDDLTEDDLPLFVIERLIENRTLLLTACTLNGWDANRLYEIAGVDAPDLTEAEESEVEEILETYTEDIGTPTPTPTAQNTNTPTPEPEESATATPTPSGNNNNNRTATTTPTAAATASPTPTRAAAATATPTPSPTQAPSNNGGSSGGGSSSSGGGSSSSSTPTPTPASQATATPVPTRTPTPASNTPTPASNTPTPASNTPTPAANTPTPEVTTGPEEPTPEEPSPAEPSPVEPSPAEPSPAEPSPVEPDPDPGTTTEAPSSGSDNGTGVNAG